MSKPTTQTPFFLQKYSLEITRQMVPYRLCILRDYDKSLDKIWHVEYYIFDEQKQKLVRRRVSLTQPTAKQRYTAAKEIIADIDKVLKQGAVINRGQSETTNKQEVTIPTKASTKLLPAIQHYRNYTATIVKPRTLEVYDTDLKRFTDFLVKHDLTHLTLESFNQAQQFIDYLKLDQQISNRSTNNNRNTISTVFNFYIKRKLITSNPFEQIAKLPSVAQKHTAFTDKQRRAFRDACLQANEKQLLLFIGFIFYTFLRPRYELRLLRIQDLKEKTVLVIANNAKDRTTEHVMIPPPLEKLIMEHNIRSYPDHYYIFGANGQPGDKPIDRKTMYERHRRILQRLKLTNQNLDTYSWKHTGVIALFRATQNIELIRQQCRHSDIATTQKYLRDLGLFVDYSQINQFPEL